jgi:hypothetical protein
MKVIHIVFGLLLLVSALAQQQEKKDKSPAHPQLTQHKLPKSGSRDPDSIYQFVDHGLREKYWYYLTKACLIYVAAVDKADTYQFLAVYRNLVGTFLAITTWKNQSSTFDVNTLVRLGNGFAKNSNVNYKPVNLQISHFRYNLGQGQYLIDVSDCGDVDLNGHQLSDNLQDNLKKEKHFDESEDELIAKCKAFSEFTVKKFWYYLLDAHVAYSSVGTVSEKNYCLVTYVNIAGTFFVIGNEETKSKAYEVNTFVRLGNGYEEDS